MNLRTITRLQDETACSACGLVVLIYHRMATLPDGKALCWDCWDKDGAKEGCDCGPVRPRPAPIPGSKPPRCSRCYKAALTLP